MTLDVHANWDLALPLQVHADGPVFGAPGITPCDALDASPGTLGQVRPS